MSDKLKVKADFALFERNRSIRSKMQYLSGIIQNDIEVSIEELQEARQQLKEVKEEIDKWWSDTLAHINKCNP